MNSTSSKTILTKVPTNLPPEREYFLTVSPKNATGKRKISKRHFYPSFLHHVRFVDKYEQDNNGRVFFLVTDRLISYLRTHTRKEFFSTRTHPWSVDRKRKCKVNLQQNHTCSALPIRPATDHQAARGQLT